MSASPPTSLASGHRAARLRPALLAAAWLGLTIAFCEPAYRVLDGDLDPSIFTAYAYYTAHGFQFGSDVVAMAGPYGFIMYGNFYGGDIYWVRFAAELAFAGIFAALQLWFFLQLPARSWTRWLWFPAQILFTSYIADLTVAWAMLLAGLFLLENRPAGAARGWSIAMAVLLGFFALWKGTHLLLSFATIGVITGAWLWQRDPRRAALIFASWLGGLLGFWLLAGQNPVNLPAYVAGTWHLAAAYNSAMSLEEPTGIFLRGAVLTAGFIGALALTAWWRRRDSLAVGGLALFAGYTFVMWKHGFVRADSHVVIFFSFATVAVVAWHLHFVTRQAAASRWVRSAACVFATGLLLTALAGPYHPLRPPLRYLATNAWPSFRFRALHLLKPVPHRQELEQKLAAQRELNQLPAILDAVGQARIDYFGYQQGILMLNRFNYRPRPMSGGTFNVYDPYLMRLNRDYLRDPARRPEFYLVKPGSIDNRFVTQDDGLALLELLQGWRPELIGQNLLLMRAVPGVTAPEPRLLGKQVFHFGESIPVPAVKDDEMLLARFVLGDSWSGGVRAALYKQPQVTIGLRDRDGAPLGERRLVPGMAVSPFIFSPLVEETSDLLDLFGRAPGQTIGSFVLTTPGERFFTRRITVEFSVVPRPPALNPFLLQGLKVRLTFPLANIVPESMTPAFKTHNVVRYIHAPSEIVWPLSGEERELAFHYGLDPRAYEEGTTNGVDFIVEVRGPSGGVTKAWSRLLRPKTVEADRGTQQARVQLPVYAPGSRVILRTDPGEYGDNAWDWSYVTNIDFRQGRFYPEQFPGFSPLPVRAAGEHVAVLEVDGGKATLLHVPTELQFDLAGHERQTAFAFGFLPGAYSADGHTAGADYVLELHRAGQPGREIYRRALRPVTVEADRGAQTARVNLPALAAGDRLILRTAPAPGGNSSWGWTYVSHLTIQ
jgi:hypothetical protein